MVNRLEGKTLGDYHLLEKVGQGGMTTVYKALALSRSQIVALKILSPYIAQDENFRTRFQREVDLLREMRHSNIVPILDYGEQDLYAYIVMPYYPKGTLGDRMRTNPFDPFEIGRLMRQISSALTYAHAKGVIHRDVKASNILIHDSGQALLSDFGFARVNDLSVSLTGSALIGTPAYMSPEQCKGATLDTRSDQYSLGIVLYQLFTGTVPFEGDTPMAVAVQHINEPLPRPRRFNPDLPEGIEKVLLKALSKDPDHRYPDIDSMNEGFQESLRQSVDAFGQFVPRVSRFDLATWIMEKTPLGSSLQTISHWWRERRPAMVMVALLALMLPTAGFALASVFDSEPVQQVELMGGADPELQATIDALSTTIAREAGQGADPALIEAAVAGTLAAQARTDSGRPTATAGLSGTLAAGAGPTSDSDFGAINPQESATSTAGGFGDESGEGSGPEASSTPRPDATSTPVPGATNTPAPGTTQTSGPGPTSTPGPTNTAPPAASNTPAPTSPPQPTATSVPPTEPPPPTSTPVPPPPPTKTPKPVNDKACKDDPDHPNYCTPEP